MDQVVRVPKRTKQRTLIERRAEGEGTTPVAILRQVLSSSPSFAAAADELGVSIPTLLKYRRRYGIQIVEEDGLD